jgi:Zn ribbon nucleic-acid-binding protein
MKLSEFKKMHPDKMQWDLVKNDFNLCLKCGGDVDVVEYEYGHWVWDNVGHKKFCVDYLSKWDKDDTQRYKCKKCGHTTQTEKSIARILQEDIIKDFQEAVWDNE